MRNMKKYGHRAAVLLAVSVITGPMPATAPAALASKPDENYAVTELLAPDIIKDISPEFAYSTDEWVSLRDNVMEYGELADLIHEYNPMVRGNRSTLSDQKKQNLTDINEQLLDDTRDLWDDASNTDTDSYNGRVQAAQLDFAGNSLAKVADQNYMGADTYKITYDQTEANLMLQAQRLTATYEQSAYIMENLNISRVLAQASCEATVTYRNTGMATETDVLTALKSVQDIDVSILSAQKSMDNVHHNLYMMLGWGVDPQPEIWSIPAPNLSRITAMNPEADREQAVANNYDVRHNECKIQNLRSEDLIALTNVTLEDARSKVHNSLRTRYNAVLDARGALDVTDIKFQLETVNMNATSAKAATGNTSSLESVQQQNAYTSAKNDVETGKMQLMLAMEKYDWIEKGLTL